MGGVAYAAEGLVAGLVAGHSRFIEPSLGFEGDPAEQEVGRRHSQEVRIGRVDVVAQAPDFGGSAHVGGS